MPPTAVWREPAGGKREISCRNGPNHWILALGRRWNPARGRCEILLQDSYGTGCIHGKKSPWECHDGKIWVSEAVLTQNALELDYLSAE